MLSRGAIPLYHQLKELLTENIEGGLWAPGHQLPTEKELAAEFRVSRTTVRQTMQLLANEGLVERVQGKGTYVSRPKFGHNLLAIGGGGWTGDASSLPSVVVHEVHEVVPPLSVATRLALAAGETTFELKRSVVEGDERLALITSWLPVRLFPGMAQLDHESLQRSIRSLLRDYYHTEVARQHKEISITILEEAEAGLLQSPPGAPALLITYLSTAGGGEPVEFRRWIVRGDRCKVFVDLETPELLV